MLTTQMKSVGEAHGHRAHLQKCLRSLEICGCE